MPLTRRQVLRRRRTVVFGGAAVVLSTLFYLPFTLLAPLSASSATVLPYTAPTSAAAELTWPTYGASAVGAIGYPGTLATSGSTERLPIASISKVVTALVVLESKPLAVGEDGPEISFTQADVQLYRDYLARNGKVEPVRAGLVLTQKQVMELTLIASANNYTASLVNWAFGSEAAYLPIARAWLDSKGLADIVMEDATGMSPGNVATASALVELGKIALANPLVSQLVSTTEVAIPTAGQIENTNDLLGLNGVRGIKTGTLDEAGACLLFAADYPVGNEIVTVVGVMLGGTDHPSLNRDIQSLLTGVAAGFHEVVLTSEGQDFGSYSSPWGDGASLLATKSATTVVWSDTPVSVLVEAQQVTLDAAGTDVGTLTFTIGTTVISVPLELSETIDDPGPWWRLTHPDKLF